MARAVPNPTGGAHDGTSTAGSAGLAITIRFSGIAPRKTFHIGSRHDYDSTNPTRNPAWFQRVPGPDLGIPLANAIAHAICRGNQNTCVPAFVAEMDGRAT